MAMKYSVTGDQIVTIDRNHREIMRQIDQKSGSPIDPEHVAWAQQSLIDGRRLVPADTMSAPFVDAVNWDQTNRECYVFPTKVIYGQSLYGELCKKVWDGTYPVFGTLQGMNPAYKDAKFEPIDMCRDVVAQGERMVDLVVIDCRRGCDCSGYTKEILANLDARLRPALFEEFVCFYESCFERPRSLFDFPLATLGSVCVDSSGRRSVATIEPRRRHLGLFRMGNGWFSSHRFLCAVRSKPRA